MSNDEAKMVWQDYWARNREGEASLDEMSATILSELLKNSPVTKGIKVLEAGCGRGIISARIAELGADVTLLDSSSEAIGIAQKIFEERKLSASLAQGDILAPPFGDMTFDLVWNAGVMEHFEDGLQSQALSSLARTIKPGGMFITFNPFAGAFFYVLGKKSAERKGTWPYGPEFPVRSLADKCRTAGLTVVTEYPICFRENLSYLSYYSKHLRSVVKVLLRPLPESFLLKVFGGYLLVTVAVRPQG
ncbi:MAG TPA: class I SAM-dependent methyltransferase [Thermodesulfovibrionales bacterium]|nr:class I SAM-dependent methyltransferase [Thermodesulfovibrionales bacterium]